MEKGYKGIIISEHDLSLNNKRHNKYFGRFNKGQLLLSQDLAAFLLPERTTNDGIDGSNTCKVVISRIVGTDESISNLWHVNVGVALASDLDLLPRVGKMLAQFYRTL